MKYDNMLSCLSAVLPAGVSIESMKDHTTRYSITLNYKNDAATVDLPKTCEPNRHLIVCKQCVATAMSTILMRRGEYAAASKCLEWPYLEEPSKGMSVCKLIPLDSGGYTYKTLYEYIDDADDAYLLAQLAMSERKRLDELIFIFPGHNIDIKTKSELYRYATGLAEEIEDKMKD